MRRERGEGTVYRVQTPAGERVRVYEPEYDEHGIWTGRRISGSGSSLREAKQALARNKRRRAAKGFVPLRRASSPTLSDWKETWIPSLAVGDETRRNYERNLRLYVLPYLGSRRLNDLTKADISTLIYTTLPALNVLGQGSIRNVWTVLRLAMTAAEEAELLTDNPMSKVKAPPKHEGSHDHERLQQRWVPRELVRHFEDDPDDLVWWFTFLGLRQSEKLGLTWSRVKNLNSKGKCYLEVHQTLRPGVARIEQRLKNKTSKREIPLPEHLRLLLVKAKRRNAAWRDSETWRPREGLEDLLWNNERGKHRSQSDDSEAWAALLKSRKLDHIRQHACRHFFVSTAVAQGANLAAVKKLVGHSPSSRVTEEIYSHLNFTDRKQVIDTVMEKLTEKKPVKPRS